MVQENTVDLAKLREDVQALCGYIYQFEQKDYEERVEDGDDVEYHPYAIALRIESAVEKLCPSVKPGV